MEQLITIIFICQIPKFSIKFCSLEHKFATEHDLMGAIFEELELNGKELGLNGFKKIILDQYNNKQFDSFNVTEKFVENWLRKNIVDEPEERKDISVK